MIYCIKRDLSPAKQEAMHGLYSYSLTGRYLLSATQFQCCGFYSTQIEAEEKDRSKTCAHNYFKVAMGLFWNGASLR